jgi:hypothetical protein
LVVPAVVEAVVDEPPNIDPLDAVVEAGLDDAVGAVLVVEEALPNIEVFGAGADLVAAAPAVLVAPAAVAAVAPAAVGATAVSLVFLV